MDQEKMPITPAGRLPKAALKKLAHPGRAPGDPRAGRVTLTTPLRDIDTLDVVTQYLKDVVDAPRANRSTVIRALCRYARAQLDPGGAVVATAAGTALFAALKKSLEEIDGESYR